MTLREAYGILGLSPGATPEEVRKAYKQRVMQCHPDQGGTTGDFIRLQAAYELICHSQNEPISRDVPIPDELRVLIDRIVNEFSDLTDWALGTADYNITLFAQQSLNFLQTASRSDLRRFNETFSHQWNGLIEGMFGDFNGRCAELVGRYDVWFDRATKETLRAEIFRPLWVRDGVVQRTPFEPMALELFQVGPNFDFYGSFVLRAGRLGAAALGATTGIVIDLLTTGVGAPLLGGLAGWAVGGAVDRAANPTDKVRRMLIADVSQLMPVAHQQVLAHVVGTYDGALRGLGERIVDNYKGRVKKATKLLTGVTPTRAQSAADRFCRGCGTRLREGSQFCSRCGRGL